MLNLSEISKISEINLLASPMYLCWTLAVCCEVKRDGRTDFSFAANAFEKLLDQYLEMRLVSSSWLIFCPCPSFQGV